MKGIEETVTKRECWIRGKGEIFDHFFEDCCCDLMSLCGVVVDFFFDWCVVLLFDPLEGAESDAPVLSFVLHLVNLFLFLFLFFSVVVFLLLLHLVVVFFPCVVVVANLFVADFVVDRECTVAPLC